MMDFVDVEDEDFEYDDVEEDINILDISGEAPVVASQSYLDRRHSKNASDIHIEPYDFKLFMSATVDGVLKVMKPPILIGHHFSSPNYVHPGVPSVVCLRMVVSR